MENFKIGLFETLGSILPGIPLSIFVLLLINFNGVDLIYLKSSLEQASSWAILAFLIVSYIIGFAMAYLSYEWFKLLAKNIWPKRIGKHSTSIGKRGKELSSIRHISPNNYSILNTFMAHRTMSYNLSFSLGIFVIGVTILHCIEPASCKGIAYATITTISVGLSILLLRRAVSFHEWIQRIITETYKIIKD